MIRLIWLDGSEVVRVGDPVCDTPEARAEMHRFVDAWEEAHEGIHGACTCGIEEVRWHA